MNAYGMSLVIGSTIVTTAVAFGCGSLPSSSLEREREKVGAAAQAFDSNASVLVDFDMDGTLVTDTAEPARVRALIQAQLLYAVGVLNEDRSLGRHERLELSAITATPQPGAGSFQIAYHARLPVAWGLPAPPVTYSLPLPARAAQADQTAFATKYGKTCVDPSAGEIGAADAGRMFLNYRPLRAGCVLDPSDVVTFSAKASLSTENTAGKYPEYHRIWEDGALSVVAVFSHSSYEGDPDDFGARAFRDFVARVDAYLAQRQPDASKRSTTAGGASTTMHAATLPDGRTVRVDVSLVGARLAQAGPSFDAWYDALTPQADVILYSGHADLGGNVRTIMNKGTFVRGKYVMWVENACDTLAYVDRTLADRRARLNPDDVSGTKYMDTVSTVLGGYFGTGPPTAMSFVDAIVTARDSTPAPKTYRQLFAELDPAQVTVVTGEEDNEFAPSMFASPAVAPTGQPPTQAEPGVDTPSTPSAPASDAATPSPSNGGSCSAAAGKPPSDAALALVVAVALLRRRRRHSSSIT